MQNGCQRYLSDKQDLSTAVDMRASATVPRLLMSRDTTLLPMSLSFPQKTKRLPHQTKWHWGKVLNWIAMQPSAQFVMLSKLEYIQQWRQRP
jgi:hypothetical protein